MIILTNLIADAVSTVMATINNEGGAILPDNLPAQKAYNTSVFRPEKKANEADLDVVLYAFVSPRVGNCNSRLHANVVNTAAGYYLIDSPQFGAETLMHCIPIDPEREKHSPFKDMMRVHLDGATLTYDSNMPIIVHAARGMIIYYQVQEKVR